MNNASILFLLLFLFSSFINADEKIKIPVGKDTTITYDSYIIFVKSNNSEEGEYKTRIIVENTSDSKVLILFGHSYPENELKKMSSPSITFHKLFSGDKEHREIDCYEDGNRDLIIEPSEKDSINDIEIKDGEIKTFELPIYVGEYKSKNFLKNSNGRNKIQLMGKLKIELELEAIPKQDDDFIRVEKESSDLIEEISKQKFCRNKMHKPSLKEQETHYKDAINKIISEIDSICEPLYSSDVRYHNFIEIKTKLEKINFSFYEYDCGMHRAPVPPLQTCKYCGYTPEKIRGELEMYYQKIRNKKVDKQKVMKDVDLLYGCKNHSSKWKKSSQKNNIEKAYTAIKGL